MNTILKNKFFIGAVAIASLASCNSSDNDFDSDFSISDEATATVYPSIESVDTSINYLVVDFVSNFTLNDLIITEDENDSTAYVTELESLTDEEIAEIESDITYEWDFGDDNTSSEENPQHIYDAAGDYTVTLTISYAGKDLTTNDIEFDSNIYSFDVTVAENDTSFTSTELLSNYVYFENTSLVTDDFTYAWDFGDDLGSSTDVSPSYQYTAEGTYTVTMVATNITDSSYVEEITGEVTVSGVDVSYTTTPDVGTTNVVFDVASVISDDSLFTYAWDFGDGEDHSSYTSSSETYTFSADGTYTVVLTTTDSSNNVMSYSEDIVVTSSTDVEATFAAVILNGTMNDWTSTTSENADAWDMTPNSTLFDNDGVSIASPYRAIWYNSDLNTYLDGVYADSEQPGSSSTSNLTARSMKLNSVERRLYQEFAVEAGVTYTITAWVRSDSAADASSVVGSFYVFDNAITTEVGIDDANLVKEDTYASGSEFLEYTFQFTATTNLAVLYYRTDIGTTISAENIYVDDISISTPGF